MRFTARRGLLLLVALASPRLHGEDCNGNGIEDAADLRPGSFGFAPAAEAVRFEVGVDPRRVLAQDLDGDGDADLVVECLGEVEGGRRTGIAVWVLLLEATALVFAEEIPLERTLFSLDVADLDRDGRPDLLMGDGEGLWIHPNDGKGRFAPPAGPSLEGATSVLAIGDLNGDGTLDLALHGGPDRVSLVLAGGDGTFQEPSDHPVLPGLNAAVAADLDGDGDRDVAAACGDLDGGVSRGGISLLLRRAVATYEARNVFTSDLAPDFLAARDLDGDGLTDLATVGRTGRGAVLLDRGRGDLRLAGRADVLFPANGLACADLDADGLPDLAAPTFDGIRVLRNGGEGRFPFFSAHGLSRGLGYTSLSVADLDGDVFPDLIAGEAKVPEPAVAGGGGLRSTTVAVLLATLEPPASLDLDGDGWPDECQAGAFRRGDVDGDRRASLTDAIIVLGSLFGGDPPLSCLDAADANDDGALDLSDPIVILGFLFLGAPGPPVPGPEGPCGVDPDRPGSPGRLGCEVAPACS